MKGLCENCVKQDTCKKTIGIMFGFCNTDFYPTPETIEWLVDKATMRYYADDIKVVDVEECPWRFDTFDMPQLTTDLSQGTGNVIVFYEYCPTEDRIFRYVSF